MDLWTEIAISLFPTGPDLPLKSQVLFSAVELGIIDLLAQESKHYCPNSPTTGSSNTARGLRRGLTGVQVAEGIRMMTPLGGDEHHQPSSSYPAAARMMTLGSDPAAASPGGGGHRDTESSSPGANSAGEESVEPDAKVDAVVRLLDACVAVGLLVAVKADDGDAPAGEGEQGSASNPSSAGMTSPHLNQRRYTLTEVSEQYLTSASPTSLSGALESDGDIPCLFVCIS